MLDVVLWIENRIYREGLEIALQNRAEVGRLFTCCDLAQLCRKLESSRFDVILIDNAHEPRDASPASIIRTVFGAARGCPVVALGLEETEDEVLACVEAGAAAFVTKRESIEDLVSTMRAAAMGELRCAPRIVRLMQERLAQLSTGGQRMAGLEKLSQRECHILRLLDCTMSNKQIARELGLEVSTIKNHVHNIIVKLSVKSRTEAASVLRLGNGTHAP